MNQTNCIFALMKIAHYIVDLLVLHDCVIIPDFGALIANLRSAKVSEKHYFCPENKEIGFNSQLKHSDGLLVNTIATREHISYEEAQQKVSLFVQDLKEELERKQEFTLDKVGHFRLDEHKSLLFTPDYHTSFYAGTLGMESFHMPVLDKVAKEKTAWWNHLLTPTFGRRVLVTSISIFAAVALYLNKGNTENVSFASIVDLQNIEISSLKPSWLDAMIAKYKNTALFQDVEPAPNTQLLDNSETGEDRGEAEGQNESEALASETADATGFDAEESMGSENAALTTDATEMVLPEEIKTVPEETTSLENRAEAKTSTLSGNTYHIMVGCFSVAKNAEKLKTQLERQGLEATLFDYKQGMTGVIVGSYPNFNEAQEQMNNLRAENSRELAGCWVMKRRFN